ncbi:MAG: aminoglycoside phosphotransferase family protein [Symbiobacteriia bacterium]
MLADGGNLIARLLPYPIVARVTTLFGDEDPVYWREVLAREVRVSLHLKQQGVPVVAPTDEANPGPHPVGGTWFSLWEYVPPAQLSGPGPPEALYLLQRLAAGMLTYPDELPVLGAWAPVSESMTQLLKTADEHIRPLADFWRIVDRQLRDLPSDQLTPAHGDAHLGNLIAGPSGWLWIDFEDSSLMPKFWDLASAVARTFLLGEAPAMSESLIRGVLGEQPGAQQQEAFRLALAARSILSVSTNLALAQYGHSDLTRARQRLDRGLQLLEEICPGS